MSVSPNQSEISNTNRSTMNDEIDLFELVESLWQQKLIIIVIITICALAGYSYTVYESSKPILYQGKILLESGAYITQENEIRNLHSPSDMAMMISTIKNVNASAPNGTSALIEVTISDTDKNEILANFDKVYEFTEQRDNLLISKLESQQIIKVTRSIGEPEITKEPNKSTTLVILLSIILGGMLGVFVALIRAATNNRRAIEKQP